MKPNVVRQDANIYTRTRSSIRSNNIIESIIFVSPSFVAVIFLHVLMIVLKNKTHINLNLYAIEINKQRVFS